MEDKQLNFNQPLLSVRRFSSLVASKNDDRRKTDNKLASAPDLPYYKSELKSGPVRNAGTIPFIWEQSPGRPKYDGKPQTDTIEGFPTSPNPPPGRILKPRQLDSDKNFEDLNVDNCNAEVYYEVKNAGVPSLYENETKFGSSKDRVEDSSDSGYDDDTYLDALDTLSRSESFNLNCSVSGVSGLDGPGFKPSGIFSADRQTRDFMMGRFLPAAKAMASETPQHAPRRLAVVEDQPRQIKVVSTEKCHPLRYGPNITSHYAQENEEEESDDEFDEHGRLSAKICGLLPRFCLKNSFFILNTVPGMSMRTQTPMSPVKGRQARSLSSGSSTVARNECSKIVYSGQRQTVGEPQTNVFNENKGILKNGFDRNINQKLKGSSTQSLLKGNNMSLWRNKSLQSFHMPNDFRSRCQVVENAVISEFISLKNTSNSITNVADHNNDIDIASATPAVEKTLYIDIVHKVGSPEKNAYSSVMKGPRSLRGDGFEILTKCEGKVEKFSVDSSPKNKENVHVEKTNLQPDVQKPFESIGQSSAAKSKQEVGLDTRKGFKQNGDLYQESTILANSKSPENINFLGHEVQWSRKAETSENSDGANSEFSAPPPLPKSPSDSWLCRTLGSVSSRNAALTTYFGAGMNPRTQNSRTSSNAKLPTTIKTAKELMRSIPE